MRATVLFLPLLLLATAAAAQPPTISYANHGTHGGETLILTGEGFVPDQTEVRVWTPEADTLRRVPAWNPLMSPEVRDALRPGLGSPTATPPLPATPPDAAVSAPVLRSSPQVLACVMPDPILLNTRVVWAGVGGQWSAPFLVNPPEVWWTLPENPSPGGFLEVFGRCLRRMNCLGETTLLTLRPLPDGEPVELVSYSDSGLVNAYTQRELEDGFWAKLLIPDDFPLGPAELRAHNYTGGPHGWSAPFPLEVVPPPAPPDRLINARERGVHGDGLADDGPALQDLIQELAEAGGGLLYLPPGVYATSRTLQLGGHVTVRGAAKENTVVRGLPGVVMPEPGAIFQGGSDWALENLTILGAVGDGSTAMKAVLLMSSPEFRWPPPVGEVSSRWAIRRCRLESYIPPQGRPTSTDRGNTALWGLRVSDFEITDSEIIGFHGSGWYMSAERGRIERNFFRTLSPTGGGPIGGGRFCVVRDNIVDICTRGINPGWRENYVAWNVQTHIGRNDNAGETFLAENAFGPFWRGRPAEVLPDGFVIPPAEYEAVENKPPSWEGWVVTVVGGRGLGQVRDVVAVEGTRVLLDQPWLVAPDEGSLLNLAASGRRLVLMGNVTREGDAAIQFWGSSVECYVERTVDERTMGAMSLAGYRGPVFWTEFRNNRFRDRGSAGYAGIIEGAVSVLGNSLRLNEVFRAAPQMHTNQYYRGPMHSWMAQAGAWLLSGPNAQEDHAQFNVIERNLFRDLARGIHLGPRTANNVVRENRFTDVPEPLLDEGTGNHTSP